MIKKPMKADTIEDTSKLIYPVFATRKEDGIRMIKQEGKALTLSFEPIPNNYIRTRVEATCPDGFDGELIVKGKPSYEINSYVMSEDGEPDFTYVVFDYVIDINEPYLSRMERLSKMPPIPNVEYLLPKQINNEAELLTYEKELLDIHYEGVMVRSPNGPYKEGRSTIKEGYLLKLKRFTDAEATIIGFHELMHNDNKKTKDNFGNSKRSTHKANQVKMNTLGAFQVRKLDSDIEFKIGTGKGLTAELRKEIWDNQPKYLGSIIKYKSQKHGEKIAPRIPVFLGFRDKRDL